MAHLIDTDIAIDWRDGDPEVLHKTLDFPRPPAISIMTQIELLNGVHAHTHLAAARRLRAERLFAFVQILPFDDAAAKAYDDILAEAGYARGKVFDRMIAATALVHGLTLVAMNGADFRDVPRLQLDIWPSPGAQ